MRTTRARVSFDIRAFRWCWLRLLQTLSWDVDDVVVKKPLSDRSAPYVSPLKMRQGRDGELFVEASDALFE